MQAQNQTDITTREQLNNPSRANTSLRPEPCSRRCSWGGEGAVTPEGRGAGSRKRGASSESDPDRPGETVLSSTLGKSSKGTDRSVSAAHSVPGQCLIHRSCNFLIRVKIIRDSLKTGTKLFRLPEKHSIPNANLSRERTKYSGG